MAAVRANWHLSSQNCVAGSVSVRDRAPTSSLRLVACHGDSYRPGENTGLKRPPQQDLGSVVSKYSRLTYSSRPTIRNFERLPRTTTTCNIPNISRADYFKPGTLIIADHFEEAYDHGSILANNKSIIRVAGQKDICRKGRFFIVLAAHAETYISLPIYSHNGNGTKNKTNPEEYISIRDHRAAFEAPSQSIHQPVVTEDMSGPELMAASVAHLAYPVARKYITPVTVIGRLSQRSTSHLIQLFTGYMPVTKTETSKKNLTSSTKIVISASMSVSDALTSVELHRYAHLFDGLSWTKAATRSDSAFIEMGVKGPEDRKKLSRFFEKVKIAKRAGPDWKLTI